MSIHNSTSQIIDDLLVGMLVGGTLAAAFVAPSSIQALEKPVSRFVRGSSKRRESRRIAAYLRQQKLVSVEHNDDGSYTVSLTQRGSVRARRAHFEKLIIPKNKKWDGKWRIIMSDIPEKHKRVRDYLAFHLKRVGFKPLQRSVFVFPYPVDDFLAIIRELFPEVGIHLVYLTTDDLEVEVHNHLVRLFRNHI